MQEQLGSLRSLFLALVIAAVVACEPENTENTATTPTSHSTTSSVATDLPNEDGAEAALIEFLAAMRNGRHRDAAKLYGGTYETLIDWNPDMDRSDHVGLLEAACTAQLSCDLLIHRVSLDISSGDEFTFVVEFETDDGELVTSRSPIDDSIRSEFQFRVSAGEGGYRILDLPVYIE